MYKKKSLWIPFFLLMGLLLFNFITFYYFQCRSEYLESKNYLGVSQSISRSSYAAQKQILRELPEDPVEALLVVQKIIDWKLYPSKLAFQNLESEVLPISEDYDTRVYTDLKIVLNGAIRYKEMRNTVGDHAQKLSQISIFQTDSYQENLAATAKDFYGLNSMNFPVVLDYGINVWMNYRITDFLLLLLGVATAIGCSMAHKARIDQRVKVTASLLVTGAGVVGFGAIILYLGNFFLMSRFLDHYDLNMWVQSFASFQACSKPMLLWSFLILMIAAKVVFGLVIYGLVVGLFYTSSRKKLMISVVLAFLTAEYLCNLFLGDGGIAFFLREINIWSLLSFERFFITYSNLNLLGMAVSRISVYLWFLLALSVGILLYSGFSVRQCSQQLMDHMQYAYYQEMNEKYTQMRHLWHDFHNHLLTIQELTRREEYEAANSYIKELETEIDQTHLLARSGLDALDVLLYQKSEVAKSYGITLELQMQAGLSRKDWQEVDICCIVGNLLDNSIEALKSLDDFGVAPCVNAENSQQEAGERYEDGGQRKVSLELNMRGEMLLIHCSNPFLGEVKPVKKDGEELLREEGKRYLFTTKKDMKNHGFGLASVERICKKYHGSMQVRYQEQEFVVDALLMKKSV